MNEMDITDQTALADIDILTADLLSQLSDLGISTVGELLGATQALQRVPSDDPAWGSIFLSLREIIGSELLLLYQEPLPLPPTGLRIMP